MQRIGQIIRACRLARGLTLRDLAARVECSHGYLCQIERARTKRPPSEALLRRLEVALGVPQRALTDVGAWHRLPDDVREEVAALRAVRSAALDLAQRVARTRVAEDAASAEARRLALALLNGTGDAPCGPASCPILNAPGEPLLAGLRVAPEPCGGWAQLPGLPRGGVGVHIADDAMAPRLGLGELVLFAPPAGPEPGATHLVELAGEPPIIRLMFEQGGDRWRLQPVNVAWPARVVGQHEVLACYRALACVRWGRGGILPRSARVEKGNAGEGDRNVV